MNKAVEKVTTNLPAPGRVGQATAIEQSRAVAEVQAAVVVAQQCPRSIDAAVAAMRQSCQHPRLAERAFYRFPRADTTVTGPSVYLARELARTFGNVQYGIAELRRDDDTGISEMQAWAWDVQTNTRSASIFVVPHKRDTKFGVKPLTDMRDVYENNANQGARRLRECILAILPPWFVEEAKDLCAKTITDGGGKPLPLRIADAIKAFEAMGVTADRVEQRLGRPRDRWTEHDVAQLTVTYRSLERREVTIDEEFPPARVTADEIRGQADASDQGEKQEAEPPASGPEPEGPEPGGATQKQKNAIYALFNQCDWNDRDSRLMALSAIIGRIVSSTNALTRDEAGTVIDTLQPIARGEHPDQALADLVNQALATGQEEEGGQQQ